MQISTRKTDDLKTYYGRVMRHEAVEMYNEILEGEFEFYRGNVERLLRFEQVSHQGLSFLAVQHDVWSNAAGNSVIGFRCLFAFEAQTCLNRVSPENCFSLLLDPRTISCARQVIVQCLFERHNAIQIGNDIYNETVELLKTKHQQYYSKIRALNESTDGSNVPAETTTTGSRPVATN